MKKLRILLLVHQDLVPDETKTFKMEERLDVPWITEYDVARELRKMGHELNILGVYSDLKVIREKIDQFNPHLVYNLLEEFDGESLFDQNVVSYLELLRVPYTGCNPRGLILARDKALTKKVLTYHRIDTAKFQVFPKNRKVKLKKNLSFPLIVKCLSEEASLGLSQASVVSSEEKLLERLEYVHQKLGVDAIVEPFIEGREFYVGVYGNYRVNTLPVWELLFKKADNPEKEFYSRRAKWNEKYRQRKGIDSGKAKIDIELEKKIQKVALKTYRALNLSGYARIDLRMDANGVIYVIEANPNPNIAIDDDFARSASYEKINYSQILQKILNLGLSWNGPAGKE